MKKKKYLFSRFMAALTDLVITLLPLIVWDIIILIMLAGFLPSSVMTFLDKVIIYVLVVSFCVTNPFITLAFGKTIGQLVYDFTIKDSSGKDSKAIQRILREFLGGVLLLGSFFILNGLGFIAYIVVNFLLILIDKKAKGFVDFLCHTEPVRVELDDDVIVVEDKKKEPVKEVLSVPSKSNAFYHYDLHVHSRHSVNGKYTVEEIFQKAKELGIKVLSITDQYSVKANVEASILSEPYGIAYIPGIEMDCLYNGYVIKVLGYNIDYKNSLYTQLENEHLKQQRSATAARIEKFKEVTGIDLNFSKLVNLTSSGIVTAEMIVKETLENPLYDENELVKQYKNGDNAYQKLYFDYFTEGKPCYVQVELPDLEDVIESIKVSNGLVVLATPKTTCGNDDNLLKELLSKGFDGIEVFTNSHDDQDIKKYLGYVKDLNLFPTCGSNYYGAQELLVEIGDSKACDKYEKVLRIFIDRCLKKVEK